MKTLNSILHMAITRFCMLRFAKLFAVLALLATCWHSAQAFVLLGPGEEWQTAELGFTDTAIGGPMNIGDEYRWNTPNVFYAYDQSYLEYFGSNGVYAADSAFGVLNALTNTPFSTLDLNQFPLEAYRINLRAQSLRLLDVKTQVLRTMVEGMGLGAPDEFTWALRSRVCTDCPACIYYVVMRNFDPFTYAPSAYVNGVLYTYFIQENCVAGQAKALNFPVDPLADQFSSLMTSGDLQYGAYSTGLDRDTVGGLKYMMRTNNVNFESPGGGGVLFSTNTTQAQLLYTTNLTLLSWAAQTNTAEALQAFLPGLVIASTTNIYSNVWVTNITAYLTNQPWQPATALPQIVYVTNRTFTIQTYYKHTFANLYTISNYNGTYFPVQLTNIPTETQRVRYKLQEQSLRGSPWKPIGGTNLSGLLSNATINVTTTTTTHYTNAAYGDIFVLPTNACQVALLGLQAELKYRYTNVVLSATNSLFGTNSILSGLTNQASGGFDPAGTNLPAFTGPFLSQEIYTFTNKVFLYYPVECVETNATLYQGIDKVSFVRTSFDSLIGRYYQPFTNLYYMVEITNSMPRTNWIARPVIAPDILINARDLVQDLTVPLIERDITWVQDNVAEGQVGPGTIAPTKTITFDKVGPIIVNNYNPAFIGGGLSESTSQGTNWVWASFDGSGNDPIIYPGGTSLASIEEQIIFQITADQMPDANIGIYYSAQIPVTGGQAPYTWAPTPDSGPLPMGLTLSSSGILSGTPEETGEFVFTVSVTEAGGRSTLKTLTLLVNP